MPVLPVEWIAEARARLDSIDRRRLLTALALIVLLGLVLAYCARPKPPKPADVAAKVRIETAVEDTRQDLATDVLQITEDTHHANTRSRKRLERAVAAVRQAAASPAGDPDRAFYLGMCQSRFYKDAPECDGYGGGPEGGGSSAGP